MLRRTFKIPLFLTLFVTIIFQLTACDGNNHSDTGISSSEDKETLHKQVAPQLIAPKAQSEENTSTASEPNTSKQTAPKRTIDLTLPEDWDTENETLIDVPENKVLPDLFTDKKKAKNMNLDGKVLKDEKNEDYIEAIEGAEVSVEVKL